MRKFIFISSGLIFALIAAALVIIGSGEKDNMLIILAAAAVPLLFVSYWNFYSVYYENRINPEDGYFTYKSSGSAGIGLFYNKLIAVPVFLVLFGSAAFAIAASFLAADRATEVAALILLCISFLYSLIVTIYFTVRIKRGLISSEASDSKSNDDEIGYKIAFFFASVATLGLFPLIYFLFRSIRKTK